MLKPVMASDEQKRLASLRALCLLDTAPEERFDRITRLAKRLFGVPMAMVSLVDENRQWFKSSVGLSTCETPRDVSFCGHTILSDDVMIIHDTAADPRFADNPLVTSEPFIGFYAGCRLQAPDGQPVGSLCVMDHKPRVFTAHDIGALKDLAAIVQNELATIQLATEDGLTGLLNRRGFMMLADNNLQICARQNLPASLVFLDLDKFKALNDIHGHAVGDQALIEFAQLMEEHSRASDIVARIGGDEFVAFLTDTPAKCTKELVARLEEAVKARNQAHDNDAELLFSFGVVAFDPKQPCTIDELLEAGDKQMYAVKNAKKRASKQS